MTTQELDEGVTITVDLANGKYQVTHLIVHTCTQADTFWHIIPQMCNGIDQ